MTTIVLGALAALTVSVLAPIAVLPLLRRSRVVDVATARSSHEGIAVRGLGVAPLVAILIATPVAALSGLDAQATFALVGIVGGAGAIAVIGLVEDVRGLPIALRAALQFMLGALAGFALLLSAGLPALSAVALGAIAGLWVAAYVNITNFMDGVDGISASHGAVTGLSFVAMGVIAASPALALGGAVLAAAFLGFAPWNLGPGKRFLGDVGSYLLGGLVALLAVAAVVAGLPLVSVLGPVAIYGADTAMTLFRRVLRGDRWYESHREHVYQRITARLSHTAVATTVAVATAFCALTGLLVALDAWPWWLGLAVIAAAMMAYLALPGVFGIEDVRWHLRASVQPGDYRIRTAESTRVVVLGASGFVGSAVAEHFRSHDLQVSELAAPRLMTAARSVEDLSASIEAQSEVLAGLQSSFKDADIVVLAAGLAAPDDSGSDALYGANALLPAIVAKAADRGGVRRLVHLSSAAVQGRTPEIDESTQFNAFSPYSHSKALGEAALLEQMLTFSDGAPHTDVAIVRATSVQGDGRPTTKSLTKLAHSRLSSVASPGDQPTVVSTVRGLAEFVLAVSIAAAPMQGVRLQPWENHSVTTALVSLSGREPTKLPAALCRAVIAVAFSLGQFVPKFAGIARRLELLWFGQRQQAASATSPSIRTSRAWLQEVQG
ncbi:NAD-dependent epimerase/dehydratase family protein [Agrococcus beijingensis]|uniref:NAD-dependent epimerase/dehydratase family protein n=1 Tax=Agrococcus beijingensis TaxID=3068634 RepID=UPI0027420048|nr:NAD-dependent epimerase/dehydratase family protein [Agrococcus sp. REN33]